MDHVFVNLDHDKTHFIQATAPNDWRVKIGTLWSDTTANLLKRCSSLSPLTFVSTEGGGGGGGSDDDAQAMAMLALLGFNS